MSSSHELDAPFEIKMTFADDWEPNYETSPSLPRYLEARKRIIIGPDESGSQDWNVYKESFSRHIERLENFLVNGEGNLQNLVYGNIQSGKTAHLLGNICWAKDTGVDIVILFSGSTTPLNDQTYARLKADLPSGTARVDMVPTETATPAIEDLSSGLMSSITSRLTNKGQAIPIVVMLKNPNRLAAMISLINNLNSRFQQKLTVMVIDDEADQSSPDGNVRPARTGRVARRTTHGSISELLGTIQGKIIYLAYTATPQALMVGDIENQLHPRYCTVIPAGRDYVGIKDITDFPDTMIDTFATARATIGDPEDQTNHKALQYVFAEFLILTWLHRKHRNLFHTNADGGVTECRRDSIQLLIHPSSAQAEHAKYFEWVKEMKESWVDMFSSPALRQKLIKEFIEPAFSAVLARFDTQQQVELSTKENMHQCLDSVVSSLSSVGSIELKLVNSDERAKLKKIGTEREFLPDDERGEWEGKDWVLIGGDILGRGLTIPHLTTTIFLRDPSQPNFDVSMQQMRFLGYRKSYEKLIRVCAPAQVIEDYKDAAIIATLARRRAESWDRNNRDLIKNPDPIVFQAPEGARYRPTRNNVTSVEVKRKQISTTGFFSLNRIANPSHFDHNMSLIGEVAQHSFEHERTEKWNVYRMTTGSLLDYLREFHVNLSDRVDLEPFLELLSFDSKEYGLADKNASFVLDNTLSLDMCTNFRERFDISERNKKFLSGARSILNLGGTGITNSMRNSWKLGENVGVLDGFNVKAIVGDSERSIGDFEPESIKVHARIYGLYEDAASETNPLGWGLTLIGWTPLTGTQMWIHEGAINE